MFERFKKKHIWYALGVITAGFIVLTVLIILYPRSFIDVKFSHEVQEHQNPFLDNLMIAISWFGYYPGNVIVVILGAVVFLLFGYWKEALFVLLTSVSGLVSTVVKILVHRPRPAEPIVRIVQKVSQESFPSGHVLFYIVFFGFIAALMYQLKTIVTAVRVVVAAFSLLLIFTVPFSRMYLGAHWFSDVLGGFLLGILVLFALCYFYLKAKTFKRRQKQAP
jgi:membrane-associated phospholipid phosphatase